MTEQSRETDTERLLALSEQVSRVADSLAQIAVRRSSSPKEALNNLHNRELSEEAVSRVIRGRRQRADYLPSAAGLLADPVWDMMLYLLHAEMVGRPVSLPDLCDASGLPAGVGSRWLTTMRERGLVIANDSSTDLSAGLVELEPEVSSALRRYFREVIER